MVWGKSLIAFAAVAGALAQEPAAAPEKWRFFLNETLAPETALAGAFDAGLSQATHSQPDYGVASPALAQRFGASLADITGQNFFQDFVMASLLHEDTRYTRRGPAYGGVWARTRYAITSAFVTHSDSGGRTFNWSNLSGTAISTGLSDLYYPASGRRLSAISVRYGTNVIGVGLGALFPEFWPDVRGLLQRHHMLPRGR